MRNTRGMYLDPNLTGIRTVRGKLFDCEIECRAHRFANDSFHALF
jgi:hypothetical protein